MVNKVTGILERVRYLFYEPLAQLGVQSVTKWSFAHQSYALDSTYFAMKTKLAPKIMMLNRRFETKDNITAGHQQYKIS